MLRIKWCTLFGISKHLLHFYIFYILNSILFLALLACNLPESITFQLSHTFNRCKQFMHKLLLLLHITFCDLAIIWWLSCLNHRIKCADKGRQSTDRRLEWSVNCICTSNHTLTHVFILFFITWFYFAFILFIYLY